MKVVRPQTDKEVMALDAAPGGIEIYILEKEQKDKQRLYLVCDKQDKPAIYTSVEEMTSDNYGQ